MKKVLCLLAALCLLAVLGGCARQGGEEQAPVPTLAPAVVDYEAPERGQPKLGVRSVHLEGTNLKDTVEALIRRVLSDVNGSGVFLNARDLELYREAPVEISRGICTVNLSSSEEVLDKYEELKDKCTVFRRPARHPDFPVFWLSNRRAQTSSRPMNRLRKSAIFSCSELCSVTNGI